MAEEWITIATAVELSGYHPDHLRELMREKRVEARKFATVWQVNRISLLAYMHRAEKLGAKRGPKRQG